MSHYFQKEKIYSNFFCRRLLTGFTLIEVLVAIFLITVGVLGVWGGLQKVFSAPQLSSSKLIASNLVQEGMEIVKNIRDGNWLEQRTNPSLPWDQGISDLLSPGGSQDYIADYQSSDLLSFEDKFLNLDVDGFYSYSPGQSTHFKRKITVNKIDSDSIKVEILVSWQERGDNFEVSAETLLYNWK